MKVMYKTFTLIIFSWFGLLLPIQTFSAEILGGGGNPAEKLILDWTNAKPENRAIPLKFSSSIRSNDLNMLQNGKIDFAILDTPVSDAELASMKLMQIPFALSGVAIVVNLQNTLAGALKLDSQTLGKIFSGEILYWDDPAIVALNPRHELPNNAITIVQSGESSTDYPVLNSYLGKINTKWKSGELSGGKRVWPTNSIYADSIAKRISTLQNTPYSIGYQPMQSIIKDNLLPVHIKNKDGNFVGLSDTNVIAAASNASIEESQSDSLLLIDKNGKASWPLSNFSFIVIHKYRLDEDKIVQLLNIVSYGMKFGSLKPMLYNYAALPDQISKSVMAKIDTLTGEAATASKGKSLPAKANQDSAEEALASKKRKEDEANRQRSDANSAAQDDIQKAEEKKRAARQLADTLAREKAVREALAAKAEAEKLAEKYRLIAKAEKEKADKEKERAAKEKAEKEQAEKEKLEKERAIQLRNQKDEDPLEAYRRSGR